MMTTREWGVGASVIVFGVSIAVASAACSHPRDETSVFDDAIESGVSSGAGGSHGFVTTSGGLAQRGASDTCGKMDIVFAVDDSGSMAEEQANLAANFPKFVKVIDEYRTKSGDVLDYRLAVTTSDDDKERGTFATGRGKSAPAECLPGPNRPWLERQDGDVAAAFACRALYGTDGSDIERPLENVLLGVTLRIADSMNTTDGVSFLRSDALLAFVILTDEDEGSAGGDGDLARPMADYAGAFDEVKEGRERWATAVIAGPSKCSSPMFGDAAEAVRLKGFVAEVGKNGVFASICTGDLTSGLTQALETFDQACQRFGGVH